MKIVFYNVPGAVGGGERTLLDLFTSLRATDPSLSLHLLLGERGPLEEQAQSRGITTSVVPLQGPLLQLGDSALGRPGKWRHALTLLRVGAHAGWETWRYARQLRRAIVALQPDVLHSNGLKSHLLASLSAPHGTTLIWHLQDFVGSRMVMRRALRFVSRKVTGAVAASRAVGADITTNLGIPTQVIYNAIDTTHFTPGTEMGFPFGQKLDELAGLPIAHEGTIRIGLVATYARWKGHDVYLTAASQIVSKLPALPVRFFIIGGPIYKTQGSQWTREELESLGSRLTTNKQIGFIPFQGDTAPIYRGLDVVVHASTKPEPFGLTIAEGMSCGRAVVVAQAGGAAELFTHGQDAIGVPPGKADALAEALIGLINDPTLRNNLGEAARNTAVARFDRSALGPQFLEAYRTFGVRRPETSR